jgi:cell wall-associated NlpC family hydrolase
MTGAEVIAEARRWMGTPWHHQGRLHGVGVDCGGLIVCVAQALGLPVTDHPPGYAAMPDGVALQRHIESQCLRIVVPELGAVALMRWTRRPQHVGFIGAMHGGWSLLHTWATVGQVVEHPLDAGWEARIVRDDLGPCLYRLPGVEG